MALTDTDAPDVESLTLTLPSSGYSFPHFLELEYGSHFMTPADGWHFSLDQDELSTAEQAALTPGAQVVVQIDGLTQSTGFIDEVATHAGKGGTVITVEGRDWLSPAVDAQVDPRMSFTSSQTVQQIVLAVLAPFGVTTVTNDNTANVNAISGAIYGTKASTVTGKLLKKTVAHQLKPYPREGAFAFCARICQRVGLWLWPSATVGTVVVGQPNFSGPALYELLHSTTNPIANNVLDSSVTVSRRDQPSIILASGGGGGGEFAKAQIRTYCVNPFALISSAQVAAIIANYPGITQTSVAAAATVGPTFTDPVPKPLYLYDPESHTMDELQAFCRREMSLKMRQSLKATYTILGHRLGGNPIAVDSTILISDDRSQLYMDGYVLGRRFTKSAGGGTHTQIEIIRPYSLQF